MKYEEEISIDENALEKEWLRQPGLYLKYSGLLADAEKEKNDSKENLILTYAQLDNEIREEMRLDGEKITEKVVESKVLQHLGYIDAQGKVLETTHEYQIIKGALIAIEHRKAALENLVKLWIGGYYSEPKSDEGERTKDQTRKKTQIKARKKLNKKEKK